MGLVSLDINKKYRSNECNIVEDFYVPCLSNSNLYQRAVGYFTSGGLMHAAKGLAEFIKGDGYMQLIASPHLYERDIEAINEGYSINEDYSKRDTAILNNLLEELEKMEANDDMVSGVSCLSKLVASGRLEIKLALPVDSNNIIKHGLYHEKIGIFKDSNGDKVAFNGSSNETKGGLIENFESIYVFRSWNDPEDRVVDIQTDFDNLWSDETDKITVLPFPEAAKAKLLKIQKSSYYPGDDGQVTEGSLSTTNKWRHQDEAIEAFLDAKRGILEMATGTGKTRTALKICEKLIVDGIVSTIIISADGTDLLNQWCLEIYKLIRKLHQPYAVLKHYDKFHEREQFILNPAYKILIASRPVLPAALEAIEHEGMGVSTILIHDEVHRVGSPANKKSLYGLSSNIQYKLGLSATPEREYDEEGNVFVTDEIGPVIYKFDLDDAIRRGILSPFNYYPLKYEPTEEDKMRIQQIIGHAEVRKKEGDPMSDEEVWIKLAAVYKTSEAKLPVFDEFIKDNQELLKRCIIFVETREYGDKVLDIVHKYRHDFHTYYAAEDSSTLKRFATGNIECLVTCHRLSEGIDIHNLSAVILFSSAKAHLETIQRIGRCLRTDPTNPNKKANIIDFIRMNTGGQSDSNADEERMEWLTEISKITYGGN